MLNFKTNKRPAQSRSLTGKTITFLIAILIAAGLTSSQAQDTWTQKADFGGAPRYGSLGFSIGSKGYIGTGYNGSYENDFWEYDPATGAWTQKANFGGVGREFAAGFSIGNKGYIGTGNNTPYGGDLKNDFWEYDPATNAWTQKANFGGTARWLATGFSIGNKGYIGTGVDDVTNFKNDFWEYDPATDIWSQKADFAGTGRYHAVGFSIGSKGYIGTGNTITDINTTNDFWEYDPATDDWTQKANFGGTPRGSAVGFSIGSKGYIGTGIENTNNIFYNDFWEYDPLANAWAQKASFGGVARDVATGFSIGNKGYLGTGRRPDVRFSNDFWEYTSQSSLAVSISIPYNIVKYTAPARIKINAIATDEDGTITKVRFYNGTTLLHTETVFPYGFLWVNVPVGNYILTAKATDNEGNVTTSNTISVSVVEENVPPVVSIVSPVDNTTYIGPATIHLIAKAKDPNDRISKVEFYNGATLIITKHYYPYSYTWRNVQPGTYILTAKATDDKGLSATSDPVTVTVTEPNVTLLSSKSLVSSKTGLNGVSLKLSPNPASNILQIFTGGLQQNKRLTISVVSVSGVVVKTIHTTSKQIMQMDVSSLKPGVYFLKVLSGDKVLNTRFVKL